MVADAAEPSKPTRAITVRAKPYRGITVVAQDYHVKTVVANHQENLAVESSSLLIRVFVMYQTMLGWKTY